jgi:hypothetical protein
MSSLPLISHRLFAAAAKPGHATPSKAQQHLASPSAPAARARKILLEVLQPVWDEAASSARPIHLTRKEDPS